MSGFGHGGSHDLTGRGQHPSGHTYQPSAAYTNQFSSVGSTYDGFGQQTYNSAGQHNQPQSQQQPQRYPGAGTNASTNLAAAALSSLSHQDHAHSGPVAGRFGDPAAPYSTEWSEQSHSARPYKPPVNRNQPNPPPSYAGRESPATGYTALSWTASQPTTAFTGTASQPAYYNQASQSSQVAAASASHPSATQPQRHASPLHAAQAQRQYHSGNRLPSRNDNIPTSSHNAGPTVSYPDVRRQSPAHWSESAQATVDPSQVYDYRAEQERKAKIEAEKQRRREEEEAARQAERDRVAAEEAAQKAAAERAEAERLMAEQDVLRAKALTDKKMEATKRKRERARLAREAKAQNIAATAKATQGSGPAEHPLTTEEAEMRAMFQKMREFNQRNPAMLAKLWEEERAAHASSTAGSATPASAASQAVATAQAPSPKKPTAASRPPASSASTMLLQTSGPPSISEQHVSGASTAGTPSSTAAAANTARKRDLSTVKSPQMQAPSTNTSSASPGLAGQSPGQPSVNSLWPSHKKGSLSEAAATWLNNLPENRAVGKIITKQEVFKILEVNPSYVHLCELLEGKGVKFERSAFARELLKTLPDAARPAPAKAHSSGAAAQRPPNQSSVQSKVSANSGPAQSPMPQHQHMSAGAGVTTTSHAAPTATETNSMLVQQPGAASIAVSSAQTELEPEVQADPPPPRPPANKEEAARKRTFNDLVDLTNNDSDDDDVPPRKLPPPTTGAGGPPSQGGHFSQPISFQSFMHPNQQFAPAFNQNGPNAPGFHPPGFMVPGVPAPGYGNTPGNPGSSWQTSMSGPQPPHAASARPADVPPPSSSIDPRQLSTQMELERQQKMRMKGRMLVEPIMRDRVARKSTYDTRTIARDVLLATGRHPDMRPLNHHLNVMHKLLGDHGGISGGPGSGNRSDLSTIRWDIIDPGSPLSSMRDRSREGNRLETDEADDVSASEAPTRPRASAPDGARPQPAKRGPVAKQHAPLRNDIRSPTTARSSTIWTPRPKSSTPLSTPSMASGNAIGYAAFRQTTVDEHGNVVKKKGRPVGWRKSLHSREAQGLTPTTKKPAASDSLRPRHHHESNVRQPKLQDPHYQVFPCGWANCAAELHNMDTLKKHVIKLHGKPGASGSLECGWRDCNQSLAASAAQFAGIEPWLQHVDKAHLQPIAWRLGDGPGLGEDASSGRRSYLCDEQGRSITPVITPAENTLGPSVSALSLIVPPPKSAAGGPRRPLPAATPFVPKTKEERDAVAELRKLEEFKRIIGPSFGPEGTVLANAKRRRGFVDDEDFEEVVEDDGF